jgi:hypothetical protein
MADMICHKVYELLMSILNIKNFLACRYVVGATQSTNENALEFFSNVDVLIIRVGGGNGILNIDFWVLK